ncbi:NAD(P)-dependent oxidoreductase [uncultured Paraglaciecola sp.]|uniref:2-hydroxyacid dehydrogenase n=1 Tax=uncultured Paraglaciecola sp. TaxID=1765024 RepID=UPI0030DC7A16|tara:strand:- start:414610 stop:415587 length:978 start_codon:yes stop_codon:yes gene_type:complete
MQVFLTRPLFDTDLLKTRLAEQGIGLTTTDTDDICPASELLEKAQHTDALITHTEDAITADVIAKLPSSVKLIANYGIGFSNIDIEAARHKGIVVTNTPTDEAFHATAEATVALLVAIARQIPALSAERRAIKTDPAPSFQRPTAVSIRNKITGVIGLGRIGSRVAEMMHHGFKNTIIYYDLYANSNMENELGARKVALDTLMQTADFICVNMPLSEQTNNLVSAELVAMMKRDAVFVNTARAELVDENALIERLNDKALHGAGLDVYSDSVNDIRAKNVALTSHFANFEKEAYTAMTNLIADNVIGYLCNQQAVTPVNAPIRDE